jgi:transcriptional regulator with XRE-family HTH domain
MAYAGVAIKAAREGAGLTLRQLAALCEPKVSFVYLSQVERGEREPSERWLRDVNQALAAYMTEQRRAS